MEVGALDVYIGWWRPGTSAPYALLLPNARLQMNGRPTSFKTCFQLYPRQVSFAGERFQIDICDASYFDIVERQFPFQMHRA